jgi:hypothetical protein
MLPSTNDGSVGNNLGYVIIAKCQMLNMVILQHGINPTTIYIAINNIIN